jgi:hypothetical protein
MKFKLGEKHMKNEWLNPIVIFGNIQKLKTSATQIKFGDI